MSTIPTKNTDNLSLQQRLEVAGILIIATASIIVPFLDFIGLLDSANWLSDRIPTMTLLAVGSIALYILSQNHTGMKSIEKIIKDNNELILYRIDTEKANQKLLDALGKIWSERENDFNKIFRQAKISAQKGGINTLREFLREQEHLIEKGQVFETKLKYPWDINITAINSEGDYIYHIIEDLTFRRRPPEHPNWEILKLRNGNLIWIYTDKGKLCRKTDLFPKNLRFTKIYFQEIAELDIIVIIQSHINIMPELPV